MELQELNGNIEIGTLTKIVLGAGEKSHIDLIILSTQYIFSIL